MTKSSPSLDRITAENSAGYEAPAAIAADPVILSVRDGELTVLMVETAAAVGEEGFSLPGGFVGTSESPEATARRKLKEKTGVSAKAAYVEQLCSYASPDRDPRGWIPSIAYLALIPSDETPLREGAEWKPVARLPRKISFDHRQIIRDALARVRGKLWYSNIAAGVLPEKFTLSEARKVYSAISGEDYDPGNFARDLRASRLIEDTGESSSSTAGRPARLYRFVSRKPAWSPRHGAKGVSGGKSS